MLNLQNYGKFQSTLPRGERPINPDTSSMSDKISIHAPTRGATSPYEKVLSNKAYFNPRSHEGSDITSALPPDTVTDFNPRSHEGSDRVMYPLLLHHPYFNPRSHEGSDSTPGNIRILW